MVYGGVCSLICYWRPSKTSCSPLRYQTEPRTRLVLLTTVQFSLLCFSLPYGWLYVIRYNCYFVTSSAFKNKIKSCHLMRPDFIGFLRRRGRESGKERGGRRGVVAWLSETFCVSGIHPLHRQHIPSRPRADLASVAGAEAAADAAAHPLQGLWVLPSRPHRCARGKWRLTLTATSLTQGCSMFVPLASLL